MKKKKNLWLANEIPNPAYFHFPHDETKPFTLPNKLQTLSAVLASSPYHYDVATQYSTCINKLCNGGKLLELYIHSKYCSNPTH